MSRNSHLLSVTVSLCAMTLDEMLAWHDTTVYSTKGNEGQRNCGDCWHKDGTEGKCHSMGHTCKRPYHRFAIHCIGMNGGNRMVLSVVD